MISAWEFRGVTAGPGARNVLGSLSLTVRPGEVVGVIGPNGAGKTTLLRAGLGLLPLRSGSVVLGGRHLSKLSLGERARLCGYLPQERRIGWNLPAYRIVELGAPDLDAVAAGKLAMTCLSRVGMETLAERGVLDLSGGERAKVLLARLLATRAALLVADEPVAGLDPDAQFLAMDVLRQEARAGIAIVVTLHDLNLAARSCDRLIVIEQGQIRADGTVQSVLTQETLESVFGLDGSLIDTDVGPTLVVRRRQVGGSAVRPDPPRQDDINEQGLA